MREYYIISRRCVFWAHLAAVFWGERILAATKRKKKPSAQEKFVSNILGVGFIGLGIYLLWLIWQMSGESVNGELKDTLGFIGAFFYRTMDSLTGSGKIILPMLLFGFSASLLSYKINYTKQQMISFIAGALCLLAFLHMSAVSNEHMIALGWSGYGGGVIGALLAWLITKAFGITGAYIFLTIAAILVILVATKGSVIFWLKTSFTEGGNYLMRLKKLISGFIFVEVDEDDLPEKAEKPKRKLFKQKAEPVAEKPIIINNLQEIQEELAQNKLIQQEVVKEPVIEPLEESQDDNGNDVKFAQMNETPYIYPSTLLLESKSSSGISVNKDEINEKIALLQKTLNDFGVKGQISEVNCGPAITRYEFQPAAGVKVSKIVNLADDIALSLAAAGIRIEAPIPGKAAVGIEVPNKEVSMVILKDLVESSVFKDSPSKLTVALGKDISGQTIVADLSKMPHLLIAGSTGSGKSVCMNALIVSILFKANPDEVKFLMIDPKMVELGNYNGIPHLISPVVTDPKKAASALRWAVQEMERRYELFASSGTKDMKRFNAIQEEKLAICRTKEEKAAIEILPYIVVLIDELADLMMVAPADVEDAICRLAQMARAAGIHLVVATQRPSVDVITGIIKANIPSRIAFAVSSQIDSRTILDMGGAEKLLGKGDMLFYPTGLPKPVRVQGVYVSDKEIDAVVESIKVQGEPQYDDNIANMTMDTEHKEDEKVDDEDDLIPEAAKLFIENGQASISLLQRRFRIGYNRAARIIDQMEQKGFVGAYEGSKPRQIKITMDEYNKIYES